MDLQIKRVILFTSDMAGMTAFYGQVIGLTPVSRSEGWTEFAAGGCNLALHAGPGAPGKRPPKLVFYAADVAAGRAALVKRGAKLGPVKSAGSFDLCDGKDPDGNPFQLSSR